jgi:hypothetical protein
VDLDFNKIYKFAMKDLKIMIDINSGSVHIIDTVTWDYLDKLELTRKLRKNYFIFMILKNYRLLLMNYRF